jgi:hypothetical protein
MRAVEGIRGAQHARVAQADRLVQLPAADAAAGRTEELQRPREPERPLGVEQALRELVVAHPQRGAEPVVVVRDLVTARADARDGVGMADHAVADQEEGRMRVVAREDREHLGRVVGGGPVVEGQRDERLARVHPPDEARERVREDVVCEERLPDEDEGGEGQDGGHDDRGAAQTRTPARPRCRQPIIFSMTGRDPSSAVRCM